MTEMPPMKPSVPERITAFLKAGQTVVQFKHQIETAYRDGFTAGVQAERQATDRDQINFDEGRRFERAAIIAMLREPDERMREIAYNLIADRHGTATVLRALADHLESQLKGEGSDG